ncbi:Uncharacterized membrane protein [Rhizobiales bacterium GAS191]|nr:Uncharacterized membrane protein [Rhizobiales bacterium GAS113]SEC11192.1 Uncharacterized membrane protein [Rhizobiales bacterium GAS191]
MHKIGRQEAGQQDRWGGREAPFDMSTSYAAAYLACAVVFLGLDGLWIGWIAKRFYIASIGPMMREQPSIGVALVFYAIFLAGMVVFAVIPSIEDGWRKACLLGALYGLCTYATYDLTNLATLKSFPARLAVIDLAWGICLSAAAATAGCLAAQWMLG